MGLSLPRSPLLTIYTTSVIVVILSIYFAPSCWAQRPGAFRSLPKKTVIKNEFITDRNRVSLQCEPEDFVVSVNFTHPFKGIVHAGPKNNKCMLRGDGGRRYMLRIPLDGCGTIHNAGSFSNTLTIRFHPSLELEGDELKTLVCKFNTEEISVGG